MLSSILPPLVDGSGVPGVDRTRVDRHTGNIHSTLGKVHQTETLLPIKKKGIRYKAQFCPQNAALCLPLFFITQIWAVVTAI